MMLDHALHELYIRWRPWRQGCVRRRRQRFAWCTRRTRLDHHRLREIRLLRTRRQGEENYGKARGEQCPRYNSSHRARLVHAAKMNLPPAAYEGEDLHLDKE